jgi:hypothetical protein
MTLFALPVILHPCDVEQRTTRDCPVRCSDLSMRVVVVVRIPMGHKRPAAMLGSVERYSATRVAPPVAQERRVAVAQ